MVLKRYLAEEDWETRVERWFWIPRRLPHIRSDLAPFGRTMPSEALMTRIFNGAFLSRSRAIMFAHIHGL